MLNADEFELCLIKAIQAKAESNAILNALGLTEENIDGFLQGKDNAAQKVMAENSKGGMFPILGYSYYQYANSLKGQDKHSTLLYLEYALEMSDLDLYFNNSDKLSFLTIAGKTNLFLQYKEHFLLLIGFVLGILVVLIVILSRKLIKKPKKKKYKRKIK
jgi:hypothetical protein